MQLNLLLKWNKIEKVEGNPKPTIFYLPKHGARTIKILLTTINVTFKHIKRRIFIIDLDLAKKIQITINFNHISRFSLLNVTVY